MVKQMDSVYDLMMLWNVKRPKNIQKDKYSKLWFLDPCRRSDMKHLTEICKEKLNLDIVVRIT